MTKNNNVVVVGRRGGHKVIGKEIQGAINPLADSQKWPWLAVINDNSASAFPRTSSTLLGLPADELL